MEEHNFANAVCWFRNRYGIFEEELIENAHLEVDLAGFQDFEKYKRLSALKDGDLRRIIDYSPLPKGYFDGSLKKAYLQVTNLLDRGEPVPDKLKEIGGAFIPYWQLGNDERFPHSVLPEGWFESNYLSFIISGELYNIIRTSNIEVKRVPTDMTEIRMIMGNIERDYKPKDCSHGQMLEMYLRRATGRVRSSPKQISKKIFGDENTVYKLFKERRFDKNTLDVLNQHIGFLRRVKTFKRYILESILPVETYRLYIEDSFVSNPNKNILPKAEIYHPIEITALYFVIKGIN